MAVSGATLTVQTGSQNSSTLTFGFGANEISNKADLLSALDAVAGVDVTGNATTAGEIGILNADVNDATSNIVIDDSEGGATLTSLGLTADTGDADTSTIEAKNLLTQTLNPLAQGETLDIQVGSAAKLTITFGKGTDEVATIAQLNAKLAELAGGAASADTRGEISITSDKGGDNITVGGSDNALTAFGLTAGETSNLISSESGINTGDKLSIQVGTNQALEITFGTGTNEVNTIDELETKLGNLAGGTATLDSTTGSITIKATNGADGITVTSFDSLGASNDAPAAAFGLSNSTTAVESSTVESAQRASLEKQFNDLLSQINELSEDASFNGVNLLNGDDLNVIFNEDASSKLDIKGVTFNATGLGLSRVASGSFQTDSDINSTLTSLDSAISSLRSQATSFGSNLSVVETRQNFTKTMINTLETGGANLTLADSNEEAANLLALQTRQQLSSTALSLASQSDQNVLRLF